MRRFDFLRILATITEIDKEKMSFLRRVSRELLTKRRITIFRVAVARLWMRWEAGAGVCCR